MKPPNTVYRGERIGRELEGEAFVAVCVTVDGRQFGCQPARRRLAHRRPGGSGFEWGYHGRGPLNLACALIHDAVDALAALRWYHRFMYAVVSQWGPTWSITAGEIRQWVERERNLDQAEGEGESSPTPAIVAAAGREGGAS